MRTKVRERITVEEIVKSGCHQVFRFRPSKRYITEFMVDIPLVMQRLYCMEDILTLQIYLIDTDVSFLCGKGTMEVWDSKLDTRRKIIETNIDGSKMKF